MDPFNPGADEGALFTLLYVSEIATDDAREVSRICERSRLNNERDGLTGVLVFDGHAFCQLVEGPPQAVSALRDRLERDSRHRRMRVLALGPSRWPRRFTSWRLGYAYSADPTSIARIAAAGDDDGAASRNEVAVSTATGSPSE